MSEEEMLNNENPLFSFFEATFSDLFVETRTLGYDYDFDMSPPRIGKAL